MEGVNVDSIGAPLVLYCAIHEAHFLESDDCGHGECALGGDVFFTCHSKVGGHDLSCCGIDKPCGIRSER